MGFNVDLVAARGITASDLLATMNLEYTGHTEEEPESPVVGASLPSGWYILYFNDRTPPKETDLASLAGGAEVMQLDVSEAVGHSDAKCWMNGLMTWRILYEGAQRLAVTGHTPDCFAEVEDRMRKKQASENDVDYVFNVPADVFAEITRFPYDGNPNGYPVASFDVLRRKKPHRKWWQLW